GLTMAVGYTDWQQGASEALKIGFKMGQAYEQAQKGIDVSGFNTQVDSYNAWIREHFGEDPLMLMQKLNAPVDLNKPVLVTNNTTQGGVVHAIDGMNKASGSKYTTNDINLLPQNVAEQWRKDNPTAGDGYLSGV
ncbi:MAG: hypothetical protein WCG94_01065, partial [Methanothrix sp.]